MKRSLALFLLLLNVSCHMPSNDVEQQLLAWEKDFEKAVMSNDADAIGKFLPDDWEIVGPDGNFIERARFLGVIKSGQLSHDLMESEDVKVRSYGDSAVLTALTRTKAKFMGQELATQERATDVFVKRDGRWQCVFSQLTTFKKK